MSLKPLNYKKRELGTKKNYQDAKEPQANNPIYQRPIQVGCPFCKTEKLTGRKRKFKTLWLLYMHFREHHQQETSFKDLTMTIADLIISGVWV